MGQRLDLKQTLKPLYGSSTSEVVVIEVPAFNYLMIDGAGDPNTSAAYAAAVEALFSVAYTVKFLVKKGPLALDYGVMPLEGLWWADDMNVFTANDKSRWQWTMMILQPDCVTADLIASAIAQVTRKKALPATNRLRLERFEEGRCAQVLHRGPFADEGPTIARLHGFIATHSALRGKHHEIYLSDISRADPANWKTLIRQPMT